MLISAKLEKINIQPDDEYYKNGKNDKNRKINDNFC